MVDDPGEHDGDGLFLKVAGVDGVAIVIVGGEVDLLTAPQLDAALAELPADLRVLLDVGYVTFFGSTGIGVVLGHAQRLRRGGGSLEIRNASDTTAMSSTSAVSPRCWKRRWHRSRPRTVPLAPWVAGACVAVDLVPAATYRQAMHLSHRLDQSAARFDEPADTGDLQDASHRSGWPYARAVTGSASMCRFGDEDPEPGRVKKPDLGAVEDDVAAGADSPQCLAEL